MTTLSITSNHFRHNAMETKLCPFFVFCMSFCIFQVLNALVKCTGVNTICNFAHSSIYIYIVMESCKRLSNWLVLRVNKVLCIADFHVFWICKTWKGHWKPVGISCTYPVLRCKQVQLTIFDKAHLHFYSAAELIHNMRCIKFWQKLPLSYQTLVPHDWMVAVMKSALKTVMDINCLGSCPLANKQYWMHLWRRDKLPTSVMGISDNFIMCCR
jgi:hypothetical protein